MKIIALISAPVAVAVVGLITTDPAQASVAYHAISLGRFGRY